MNISLTKGTLLGLMGGSLLGLAGCGADPQTLIDPAPSNLVEIPGTPTAVTADNQATAIGESTNSIQGSVGTTTSLVAVRVDGSAADFDIFAFASGTLLEAVSDALAGQTATPAGIVIPLTLPCASGSADMSVNIANVGTVLNTGDSFSIAFDNCSFSDGGMAFSGTMTGEITGGSLAVGCGQTQSCGDVAMRMGFDQLQFSGGGLSGTAHGSFDLDHRAATDTADMVDTVSGSDFYLYASATQGVHMSNFTITTTRNAAQQATSAVMTLASTRLGGAVDLRTTSDIITLAGEPLPSAGVIVITGANGSQLTVTLSSSGATAELDGTSTSLTWTEIQAAL